MRHNAIFLAAAGLAAVTAGCSSLCRSDTDNRAQGGERIPYERGRLRPDDTNENHFLRFRKDDVDEDRRERMERDSSFTENKGGEFVRNESGDLPSGKVCVDGTAKFESKETISSTPIEPARDLSANKGGDVPSSSTECAVPQRDFSANKGGECVREQSPDLSKSSTECIVPSRDFSAAKGGEFVREREYERVEYQPAPVAAPVHPIRRSQKTGLVPGRSENPWVEQMKCDWRDIDSERVDFHPTR
jgi:hypothetical protein